MPNRDPSGGAAWTANVGADERFLVNEADELVRVQRKGAAIELGSDAVRSEGA